MNSRAVKVTKLQIMLIKLFKIKIGLLSGLMFLAAEINAQTLPVSDTLKLTVKQAEDLFLKNNLQLIAQHYNIGIAEAQVITAKLFPNPDFSFANGLYAQNTTDGPALNEQSFSLSQLFTTAGKRNKNIQLQK